MTHTKNLRMVYMKFLLPKPAAPLLNDQELAVGNVYAARSGTPTKYLVVVAIRESVVILLGLDAEGAVSSATTYGVHVFAPDFRFNSSILGHCEGVAEMEFKVTWRDKI
jgi:hypothetical protein